jgi:hypothetical protein
VVFCLGTVLSVVAIWANNRVIDTSTYVDTVAPLAADPDIQEAIALRVTALITDRIQGDDALLAEITGGSGFLAGAAVAMVSDLVHRTVLGAVQSPGFQALWDSANEIGHRELIRALTSDGNDAVFVDDGQLLLNLTPLISEVTNRLRESGLTVIDRIQVDPARATFVLFESEALAEAQWAIEMLDVLAVALPVVAVASLVGCLLLAERRWAMLLWSGIGVAIGMVVLLVVLSALRDRYLEGLGLDRNNAAATAVFDIVSRALRDTARSLTLGGLLVAGVAAIASSAWLRQPGIVSFVARYRSGLLAGVLAAICVVLVGVEELSAGLVVGVGVIGLAIVLGLFWVSRFPLEPAIPGGPLPGGAA